MIKQDTSNTIKLLEQMASDAKLLEVNNLQDAIENIELSEGIKDLILAQDCETLLDKLALKSLIKCNIIHTPDEEDDENEDESEDEKQVSQLINQ